MEQKFILHIGFRLQQEKSIYTRLDVCLQKVVKNSETTIKERFRPLIPQQKKGRAF
jgi:hypothetical protein